LNVPYFSLVAFITYTVEIVKVKLYLLMVSLLYTLIEFGIV
jgi:hypothetical protein